MKNPKVKIKNKIRHLSVEEILYDVGKLNNDDRDRLVAEIAKNFTGYRTFKDISSKALIEKAREKLSEEYENYITKIITNAKSDNYSERELIINCSSEIAVATSYYDNLVNDLDSSIQKVYAVLNATNPLEQVIQEHYKHNEDNVYYDEMNIIGGWYDRINNLSERINN